jgi:hypothetical protein
MPCELFVYYRAAAHQAAAITEAVRCMQAALRVEIPQLQARLLRRPLENATGEYTWMETYALDPIGHPRRGRCHLRGADRAPRGKLGRPAQRCAPPGGV